MNPKHDNSITPKAATLPYLVTLILLAATGSAFADDNTGATVLQCANLVDVEAGKLRGAQEILIVDNRITAVDDKVDAPEGAKRVALGTCLPGLMDMHVHLTGQTSPASYMSRFTDNEADVALATAHYAGITLKAGFTTVRNLGDDGQATVALRQAITRGMAVGPRIYTVGKAIGTTGGHADPTNGYRRDLMGDPGPADGVINGVEDARKAVRQRYKEGADLIKITATGGVLSLAKNGQNPQFTAEELEAIVTTANDYGMHVAAHSHGAEGMKRAVLAGVRSIEHGTYMDDEIMRLMKEKGTYYVPTIYAGKFVAAKAEEEGFLPEVVRPKARAVGPQIQETFGRAYKAGVTIAFGTDMGVGPHGDNAQEFVYMVEAGMPPMEAIQSATVTTAKLLEMESDLGSITEGKLADIIAVDGNPVEDIAVLREVKFVMKDGVIYKQEP